MGAGRAQPARDRRARGGRRPTASGGDAPAQATDNFVLASRLIYKRLSDQLERQQSNQRSDERTPAATSIH